MEDYSIIQGQTWLELMFALLLTIVTASVYFSCRMYGHRRNAGYVARLTTIRRPSTPREPQSSPGSAGFSLHKQKHSVSDWLAPVIVWAAVVWTVLAVISILLGDN